VHERRARPSGRDTRSRQRRAPSNSPGRLLGSPDLRRTLAAFASAVIPGLGQLINGRSRLARWFIIPVLVVVALGLLLVTTRSPTRLFAMIVAPQTMTFLLALNVVILGWRLAAVANAFFDGGYPARSGRAALICLGLVVAAVAIPHGILNAWGNTAQATFGRVFTAPPSNQRDVAAVDRLGLNERVNILLVGIDKTPGRIATLTDTMMVVSIDPVGETATMVSLPRDLVRVPMGNGNVFGPKINSLMAYAERHPEKYPAGGMRALQDAIGALLGIRIQYHVRVDFFGFVRLVDAVGGVDVDVKKAFYDAEYDGMGVNMWPDRGWGVTVGQHHFNGWQALAYARARKADGESDFTRAARQQDVLLALRTRVMADGSLLANLPTLLDAFGDFVETDIPPDRLPDLAAVADDLEPADIVHTVLKKPLIHSGGNDPVYGSIQIPDVEAIRAVARTLFPPPGIRPSPWPTPPATTSPRPSPS
jgi:LCP family protein required for cell wall assembly